jgi:hypothetical protein
LTLFKKQKVENILAKISYIFFSWEQTLRFRFENLFENFVAREFQKKTVSFFKSIWPQISSYILKPLTTVILSFLKRERERTVSDR